MNGPVRGAHPMDAQTTAALIVAGLAAIFSFLTLCMQLWRFREERHHAIQDRLLEKRLDIYPNGFSILASIKFRKGLESTENEIAELFDEFRGWFLGPMAALASNDVHKDYRELEKLFKQVEVHGISESPFEKWDSLDAS